MSTKLKIWKHSCLLDGVLRFKDGSTGRCNPICEDPWNVEYPGIGGNTFSTLAEAMDHANMYAKAANDPEGQALVKAIHDRKAGTK